MRWLDSITNAMNMNLGKLWKMVRDREPWHAAVHGVTKSHTTGQLNNNSKLQSSGHSNHKGDWEMHAVF